MVPTTPVPFENEVLAILAALVFPEYAYIDMLFIP